MNIEKWRNTVEKIDLERDKGDFWRKSNRMLRRNTKPTVVTWRDENGRYLETEEKMVQAFYRRMKRTFRISEEDNQNFRPINEREVENWKTERRNYLRRRSELRLIDTPIIIEHVIRDILGTFKERAPGPSGITRTLLLNAPRNIHRIYAKIFMVCFATDYFPKQLKKAITFMVPKG